MWFDPQTVAGGWFDPQTKARGWFDQDIIDNSGATASNNIAGSSSITFNLSAAITGRSSLSASSPILFTTTATLTGRSSLSASANFVFLPSGSLIGRGSISAAASVLFLPAGTIIGQSFVAGSTNLVFALSGTLASAPANDISGSVALSFFLNGDLSGIFQGFIITPASIPAQVLIAGALVSGSFPILNDSVGLVHAIDPDAAPSPMSISNAPPPNVWTIT